MPTVSLTASSADAFVGQPITLTWSSANAAACTASGPWSGPLPTSGSQSVTPTAAGLQTYSISCTGAGGTANASVTVTSTTPTVSITNNFVENAVTISTSEGAPYGDGDIWTRKLDLSHSTFGYGPTKVVRLYICLSGQVAVSQCSQQTAATAPLSDQMLAALDAGIAAYASTGTRLLIRFVYHMGPPGVETPINLILTHIDQLAPILIKHRDLIFALQAGFLGDWGQWYNGGCYGPAAVREFFRGHRETADRQGAFVLQRCVSDSLTVGRCPADVYGGDDEVRRRPGTERRRLRFGR
jgi:hypothetical protein